MLTLDIGSKCSALLPQKIINPQITPAKGLIINHLLGSKLLVLVEEVWQFLDVGWGEEFPLEKAVFISGKRIRSDKWGWKTIPELTGKPDEYFLVELFPRSVYSTKQEILDEMIHASINDFLQMRL